MALVRKQSQLQKALVSIRDAVRPLTTEADGHLIRQYSERLQTFTTELKELASDLLTFNDSDNLCTSQRQLDDLLFECDLIVRKLPETTPASSTAADVDRQGVKLPKLSAPTFDGKLTSWTSFWQQFEVAIHRRTILSDVEKLAYLRNSLKDGSAKSIIEGLSSSGEFYA